MTKEWTEQERLTFINKIAERAFLELRTGNRIQATQGADRALQAILFLTYMPVDFLNANIRVFYEEAGMAMETQQTQ